MPRKIESHSLEGPSGLLEALLEEPEDSAPRAAALVCHPHPLYGGTMHNKVVYRIARGLRRSGHVVLRFNFRGVGSSEGAHDKGIGEVEDARAALEWLRRRYPGLPFLPAGFSFGSRVILRLGCGLGTPQMLLAVGFPAKFQRMEFLEKCRLPKVFIHSTNDVHGSREEMTAIFERIAPPKELHWVEARDHFFAGGLDRFEETVFQIGSRQAGLA